MAFYRWIGFGLYGLLAVLIVALAVRTVVAMVRGEICVPEH